MSQPSILEFFKPTIEDDKKTLEVKEYSLYFDGASRSNPGPASFGGVFYLNKKEIFTYKKYIGTATNNQAEYRGLLTGLNHARRLKIKNLTVYGDSNLVIQQVLGKWKVKSKNIKPIYYDIKKVLKNYKFETIDFKHVYRNNNKRADELANQALDELL